MGPHSLPMLRTSRGQGRKMALQQESEQKDLPIFSLFLQLSSALCKHDSQIPRLQTP